MDIILRCDYCGDRLSHTLQMVTGGIVIDIEPCNRCLQDEYDRGNEEGHEEGYQEGFEAGVERGFEYGYTEGMNKT